MEEELVSHGEMVKRRLENHRVTGFGGTLGGPTSCSKLDQLQGQTRALRALSSLVLTTSEERNCAALPGTRPSASPSSRGRGFLSTRLAPPGTL